MTKPGETLSIIFVICDDDKSFRDRYEKAIHQAMRGQKIPYTTHLYDDGSGARKFIRERKSAKGIVLITDGAMPYLTGWILTSELKQEGLLPAGTVLSTAHSINVILENAKLFEIQGVVEFLQKNTSVDMAKFLPHIIAKTAAEMGVMYRMPEAKAAPKSKPERPPAAAKRKRKLRENDRES